MVRTLFKLWGAGLLVVLLPASLAHAADPVSCYIDSVAGDDTNDGLSETTARASWYAIPTTCTAVKYKRGSQFNLAAGDTVYPPKVAAGGVTVPAARQVTILTNYGDTSQPLPKFIKQRQFGSGGMINGSNLTIDGLYFDGTESSVQMKTVSQGIVIMAGSNVKILNNEITNSDIGMMISGTGNLIQGNYVHTLHVVVDAPPGVDPNLVGGAEGIFVNGSNNEVAYNTFIDCSDYAEWTGGDCDGGATEVAVPGGVGGTVDGLKIHHNFGYNNCGFFEVSSMGALVGVGGGIADAGSSAPKGTFSNSTFYNNVSIDSGWISLLQVSNTDLKNIKWENNTFVQHKGSVNSGIMAIVYTACSSGMCGGALEPNTVFWTNNIWAFDGVQNYGADKNFVQKRNLIVTKDPGFVNLQGKTAADYDLTAAATGAIDQGTSLPEITLDFINRPVPDPSGKPDIGAFEYNAGKATTPPPTYPGPIAPSHGNLIGQGGQSGSAGATVPPVGAGGASGKAGATGTIGKGGATGTIGQGGTSGSVVPPVGGATSVGPGAGGKTGGGSVGASGTAQGTGGAGVGGQSSSAGSGGGGAPGGTTDVAPSLKSGCSCNVGQGQSAHGLWLAGLLGLALLAQRRRHSRH